MNRKVLIKPLAEADLVEIQNWYDVESFGLGKQFLIAFSQALLLARNNPFHFQVRYMRLVRMVRTPGFPYCIILWQRPIELWFWLYFTTNATQGFGRHE